jgi:phage repressor protein C with HTH and peptisase S24 domain
MIVVKIIREKNKKLRVQYENEHHKKFIDEFWAYIHWTNKVHVNSTEVSFQ